MESETMLSELELKILMESKKRSKKEIADLLQMEINQVSAILERANRKLSSSFIRSVTERERFLPRPIAFRIGRKVGEQQTGTMKVGSQIMELLSKGIYSAPWNSLKELISNSFDADAQKVEIQYLPQEGKLVISDDGMGMNYVDFDEHFTFIVRSLKREKGLLTPLFKRPIIGKIGIGFVAVSELCDKIVVTSAKKGEDTYFIAEIDFSIMRSEEAKHKEFHEISKYTLTNYVKENVDEHYTKIELSNLRGPFIDILENRLSIDSEPFSANFADITSLVNAIGENEIRDVGSELGPYWEFIVNLATVIPIEYFDYGPISLKENVTRQPTVTDDKMINNLDEAFTIIDEIKRKLKDYKFKVFFNGIELRKPISLPNETEIQNGVLGKDYALFPIENTIETTDPITNEATIISYKGYFYYQRKRIIPQELRGMVVRIKNVAIGGPSLDFWGHPYSGDDLYFPQTFGEVYFETGLEDAMNIDRSTFKTAHHEYAETRKRLHVFFRQEVFSTAKKMWFRRRSDKAKNKEEIRREKRTGTIKENLGNKFNLAETRKFIPKPVMIDPENKMVKLNVLSDQFAGFKKQDRLMLEDVAIALEIAVYKARNIDDVKKLFWKTLREITDYRRS